MRLGAESMAAALCLQHLASMALSGLDQLKFLLVAVLAGFVGSIMGIGGGSIIVPVLTNVFGVPIREAVAASLVGVIATSISGLSTYFREEITNIRMALFLETSTTLGAVLGALLSLVTPGSFLYVIFAAFSFYIAASQAYSIRVEERKIRRSGFRAARPDRISLLLGLSGRYFDESEGRRVEYVISGTLAGWLVSFFAGVGSGMLGIGGGFIKVSAMNLFMNAPLKVAIATSKFMVGITAATSSVVYYLRGVVRADVAAPVALGTTLGAIAGTKVMNKLRVRWLKAAFSALAAYLGYVMLRRGLWLMGVAELP